MIKALARWVYQYFIGVETVVTEQMEVSDPREVLKLMASYGGGVVKINQQFYKFTVKPFKSPKNSK